MCNEKCIAEKESQDLSEILKGQYFSILVDESTDISLKKLLCIGVKYINKEGRVTDRLLELLTIDAKNGDADHLFNAFKSCLLNKQIPIKNIVGMASDNASVMIGKNNSFLTRLQKETQALIVLPCICHSSALVASKACLKLPRTPEEFVKAIASFFSMSSKRTAELNEMQEFFKVEQLKMLKLSATRWLSMHHAVERIIANWDVLLNYFRLLKTEDPNNKSVDYIFEQLTNASTKAILLFLNYFLPYFNKFNALFQNKKILIHVLNSQCRRLYKEILIHFVKPELMTTDLKLNVKHPHNIVPLDSINLGNQCNDFIKNIPRDVKNQILKCSLDFLITAAAEIQSRFPLEDSFFEGLKFLDPKVALADNRPESIKSLKNVYNKFISLENINVDEIEREWNKLIIYFDEKSEKETFLEKTVEDFWFSLGQIKNFENEYEFKNLTFLANLSLTLPHSNAETERVFSVVTDVKTKKRNKLGSEAINAVTIIRFSNNNNNCQNFSITDKHLTLMKNSKSLYK